MTAAAKPTPPYRAADVASAYQLRFTWTGWPKSAGRFPSEPDDAFFDSLSDRWEDDGIRLLERWWEDDEIHLLVSTTPQVAPQRVAQRAKGRLQYALRKNDTPAQFSRNFFVKSVGEPTQKSVEAYVESQVAGERFVDSDFEVAMERLTVKNEDTDLSVPVKSSHGRYLYNLHVVFSVRERFRITDVARLERLRDLAVGVADKKGHRLSRLSVVPDHVHVAVGAPYDRAPEEVALAYMNNLAFGVGQPALWEPSYYAGTFGEYDMGALRQNL